MRLLVVVSIFILMITSGGSVNAFDLEKLFMPGDVIEGHKKLEGECKQCHVRLRDTTQTRLCLDCHELIAEDIVSKRGFHGINKKAGGSECKVCHTEHKGRDAKIIWLDKDRFNHKLTDFVLRGKHLQTECVDCHEAEEKYREASTTCVSCHKDDDIHKDKLGEKCQNCHTPLTWSDKKFDHDKTDFKLKDSHSKVSCGSCHVDNKYKKTPKSCIACHAVKDVHQNRFGKRCADCHKTSEWNKTSFDHKRDTSYSLKGKHRLQICKACHVDRKAKRIDKKKKPRNCYSCHRLDDVHQQSNGKKCQKCHNVQSWRESNFDHDDKTRFPLRGAHQKVSCRACHLDDATDKDIDTACYACHQPEDIHNKQQGKVCNDCHNETSWITKVRFDHDLSDFPLIGQHAATGCENCHLSSEFKSVESDCNSCHESHDVHKAALGDDCSECHNANGWMIWQFDHSNTDFDIRGAHEDLHCHQCHKPLRANHSTSQCIDCHRGDDIHNGGFGDNCVDCHKQDDFSTIDMRSMSSF